MEALFEIKNLKCSYAKPYVPKKSRTVLHIENLVIPKGKKVFIVGESGIGKSTILEVLGLMNNTIVPDENTSFLFNEESGPLDLKRLWQQSDEKISAFRKKNFNFIFQSTNLMRNFTAYENIAITRMLQGESMESSFKRAKVVLDSLGLSHVDQGRMAQELSGGQQQRLAFARAIIPDFTVLFGDEPTGNLDSENAVKAMELLSENLTEFPNRSAIIVSHDMHLATSFADVIIKIRKVGERSATVSDEIVYHGVIDNKSVFTCNREKEEWTNGEASFSRDEFESYLKRGEQ